MLTTALRLAALCWLLLAGIAFAARTAAPQNPNIVILLVDDMGYGDPRCFNPQSKTATWYFSIGTAFSHSYTDFVLTCFTKSMLP